MPRALAVFVFACSIGCTQRTAPTLPHEPADTRGASTPLSASSTHPAATHASDAPATPRGDGTAKVENIEPLKVSVRDFFRAFQENMAAGELKYAGKPVELSGTFDHIQKDSKGRFFYAERGQYLRSVKHDLPTQRVIAAGAPGIYCYLSAEGVRAAAAMKTDPLKLENLTVTGTCKGTVHDDSTVPEFYVVVEDCTVRAAEGFPSGPALGDGSSTGRAAGEAVQQKPGRDQKDADRRAMDEALKAATAEQKRQAAEHKKAARDEELAVERLRYAKKLIEKGMEDEAKRRLEKIIKDYPDTKAADEAKALLKKLGK